MEKSQASQDEWVRVFGYVNTKTGAVVIEGEPSEQDGELAHNCDEMGCNTLSHVAAVAPRLLQGTGLAMALRYAKPWRLEYAGEGREDLAEAR